MDPPHEHRQPGSPDPCRPGCADRALPSHILCLRHGDDGLDSCHTRGRACLWAFPTGVPLVLGLSVLLTLVVNRLMFHDPMPGKMVPTLMILVAPPAVAFMAWLRLNGEVGPFGHFLLSAAYVFALIVATQAGRFRAIPFALSWWARSFPLAALTIASFGRASPDRGWPACPAAGRRHRADPVHGTCNPGGHNLPSRIIHRIQTGDPCA